MNSVLGRVCCALLFGLVGYGAVVYQLSQTLFSEAFAFAEIERADPARATKSILFEHLPGNVTPLLRQAIDEAIDGQRGWIVAELRKAAVAFQDYFRGDSGRIEVSLDLAPVREAILERVHAAVQAGAAREVDNLSPGERQEFEAGVRRDVHEAFIEIGGFSFDSARLGEEWQRRLFTTQQRLRLFRPPLILVLCAIAALGVTAKVLGEVRYAGLAILAAGTVLLVSATLSSDLVALVPLPSVSALPVFVAAYLPVLSAHVAAPLGPVGAGAVVIGGAVFGLSFMTFERRPEYRTHRSRRR